MHVAGQAFMQPAGGFEGGDVIDPETGAMGNCGVETAGDVLNVVCMRGIDQVRACLVID